MTHAASDFKHAPRERTLSRLNKVLLALIALAVVIPFTYRALPIVREKRAMEGAVADAEARLEELRMQRQHKQRVVTFLKNDPEFLGLYLRDLLRPGYMAKGETIFRFPLQNQQ